MADQDDSFAAQLLGLPPSKDATAGSQIRAGNINVHDRPVVMNDLLNQALFGVEPGSVSTVHSTSMDIEDPEIAKRFGVPPGTSVLLPTVLWNDPRSTGGRLVTPKQAYKNFINTGQNLGMFSSDEAADAASMALHDAQDAEYARPFERALGGK